MLKPLLHRRTGRRPQQGLSIVELMVGVTIGLIIVAAASLLMTGQLVENRRLLTETQVQQDLRAAADLMSRDLRRAGANTQENVLSTLWYPGSGVTLQNIFSSTLSTGTSVIAYEYFPGGGIAPPSSFGFELQSQVVKRMLGQTLASVSPQDLTDGNVMRTTSFNPSVATDASATIVLPCPKPCTDGTSACWPKYQVRKAQILMEAEAKSDGAVKRAISSTVRLRNDRVVFAGTEICPT